MFGSLLCDTCGPAKVETMEFVEPSPTASSILIGSVSLKPCLPESLDKVAEDNLSEQSTSSPIESSSSGSGAICASSTLGDANDVLSTDFLLQPSKWSRQAMPSAPLSAKPPELFGSVTGLSLPSGSASRHQPNFAYSSSGLHRECEVLPLPSVPVGRKPLVSQKLPGLDIKSIRTSLEMEEGPVQRFMREILGCSEFNTTPWAARRPTAADTEGAKKAGTGTSIFFRRSRYRAAMPSDIPSSVARLVGMPDSVDARSLFVLGCMDDQLVLVQQSMVQGVMFSDRFRLQNTFSFVQEADGVLLSQWAEVIWDKPLPWTHTPVKMFVEKKARAEAKSTFRDFARRIQDGAC